MTTPETATSTPSTTADATSAEAGTVSSPTHAWGIGLATLAAGDSPVLANRPVVAVERRGIGTSAAQEQEGGQRRDQRFTGADIALQQAIHALRGGEIGADRLDAPVAVAIDDIAPVSFRQELGGVTGIDRPRLGAAGPGADAHLTDIGRPVLLRARRRIC